MTRLSGIPLSANRAQFEVFEERVEAAALARHLDRYEDEPADADEPPPEDQEPPE